MQNLEAGKHPQNKRELIDELDSIVLFERLSNPAIIDKIVKTTMIGYQAKADSGETVTYFDYDKDDNRTEREELFVMPTEEEVRAEVLASIEEVKHSTPILLDDTHPSSGGIGIFWKNEDGSVPSHTVNQAMEAHEKGHVVRTFPGGNPGEEAYEKIFKTAFDQSKITITDEEYVIWEKSARDEWAKNRQKMIEANINFIELSDEDFSKESCRESISRYLSNPNELAERMSQLKNWLGFRGDEEFTQEDLDYARTYYIADTGIDNYMKHFFDAIADDAAFLHLMNTLGI